MRADICDVCEVIFQNGQRSEDGCAAVQFGELFEVGVSHAMLNEYDVFFSLDLQPDQ